MPEFNNAKHRIMVEAMVRDLEEVPGLEMGTAEARKWIAEYAVALGLDRGALFRLLIALGVQKLRDMGENELDTIAAITGQGVYRARGADEPVW